MRTFNENVLARNAIHVNVFDEIVNVAERLELCVDFFELVTDKNYIFKF